LNPFLLSTKGLCKNFGGVKAAEDFDLALRNGELVGLIGPNGAGKTTIFNLITGFQSPTSGTVYFQGQRITGKSPSQIVRMGIGRTFQHTRLLREISILENMMVGFHLQAKATLWSILLHTRQFKDSESEILENSIELLKLFKLEEKLRSPAGALPYGDQRFLEIVRALALKPRLLLLDEPTAGMNSSEQARLVGRILDIKSRYGVAILLIEHHMDVVMNICERIVVLNYGAKLSEGTPEEIRKDPKVVEAYLGSDEDASR
jgi:branched-chain amino acid transport system ATP-binding protein